MAHVQRIIEALHTDAATLGEELAELSTREQEILRGAVRNELADLSEEERRIYDLSFILHKLPGSPEEQAR